ncbi:hypothetical protein [Paraburkholderia sp. BL10I2N1]|nr:hypothetical protein [Paraburkholderia sp. BL10I2N1]
MQCFLSPGLVPDEAASASPVVLHQSRIRLIALQQPHTSLVVGI